MHLLAHVHPAMRVPWLGHRHQPDPVHRDRFLEVQLLDPMPDPAPRTLRLWQGVFDP